MLPLLHKVPRPRPPLLENLWKVKKGVMSGFALPLSRGSVAKMILDVAAQVAFHLPHQETQRDLRLRSIQILYNKKVGRGEERINTYLHCCGDTQ